jgi:radical SAM superfamily enzyme YgiQ (UPF0313 family)
MSETIDMLLVFPGADRDSPSRELALSIFHPGVLFKQQGLRVAYWDQRFESEERLIDLIKSSKEIGVSALTGRQCGDAADILMLAKRIKPGIITAAGGPHVHMLPQEVLSEPFVDKVYADKQYGEHLSPYDEQTKPYFGLCDITYLSSTGCPYACRYCSQIYEYWPRPVEDIDRDLSAIHHDTGFEHVAYVDPNMTHFQWTNEHKEKIRFDNVDRLRQIGAIHRKLNITFDCSMRVPNVTPAMVEALVEARCTKLFLGCESGNERVIRKVMLKGHGVEAIRDAARNLAGSGISTLYSFIGMAPGETIDETHDTMDLIDWIMETDDNARVSVYHYSPYPGTPMYSDAVAGKFGVTPFIPPTTMKGWASRRLMNSPYYWIAGLNFRLDSTRANFPGDDWKLIEPYVDLARKQWIARDIMQFPVEEVEALIKVQVAKGDRKRRELRDSGSRAADPGSLWHRGQASSIAPASVKPPLSRIPLRVVRSEDSSGV